MLADFWSAVITLANWLLLLAGVRDGSEYDDDED